MEQMDRKSFVKLAGAGSAAAAAAVGIPLMEHFVDKERGVLRFRASGGLPASPLPSYATHVVEGTVNLTTQSGTVTSRVLAGHPGATSGIGLPGLSRIIRVTKVDGARTPIRLRGEIEDRSQLGRGESPHVEIVVDRDRGVVQAPFVGRQVDLSLA